jgi:curli biogenesis system outer membrane secretion channel CsgG
MKTRQSLNFIAAAFLALAPSGFSAITVAVNQANFGQSKDGIGEFAFEVLQVELAAKPDYELVDRKRLQDLLAEQSLGASGMTSDQAAKVGKLVGAKYYVFGETMKAGERTAINCRVVQIETGVLKPILLAVAKDEDPTATGAKLAAQVTEAISKLEGRAAKETAEAADAVKLNLPEGSVRPVIGLRIPETSASPQPRSADPAAEKALEAFLLANDFKLTTLSRPSQGVPAAAALHLEGAEHEALLREARDKGVQVLVLGIATSDSATHIGSFTAARARVELAAVDTRTSRVLTTTSGYGTGTDLSQFVAEKKAIESAVAHLQSAFGSKVIMEFKKAEAK